MGGDGKGFSFASGCKKMSLFWYTIRLILTDNLLKLAVKIAPVRSPEKLALRRFIHSEYIKTITKDKDN